MTHQPTQVNSGGQTAPPNSSAVSQDPFIPVVRELARAYQAFNSYSDQHIRQMGLTSPQFDVIATLGGSLGMTMGEVAEKTLVTKGTLTGIIDRLVEKKLVQREIPEDNRRCCYVTLTAEGEQLYREVFPAHIAHLRERFDKLDASEVEALRVLLKKLRQVF